MIIPDSILLDMASAKNYFNDAMNLVVKKDADIKAVVFMLAKVIKEVASIIARLIRLEA